MASTPLALMNKTLRIAARATYTSPVANVADETLVLALLPTRAVTPSANGNPPSSTPLAFVEPSGSLVLVERDFPDSSRTRKTELGGVPVVACHLLLGRTRRSYPTALVASLAHARTFGLGSNLHTGHLR